MRFFNAEILATTDPVQRFLQDADRQMAAGLIGFTLPANGTTINVPEKLFIGIVKMNLLIGKAIKYVGK
jgi:hypothetical protein